MSKTTLPSSLLCLCHCELILPIEKNSRLSSCPRAAESPSLRRLLLFGCRGGRKHGLAVLCAFAGAYLNSLCPRFTNTVVSTLAARDG
ncbi:hypothetical protein QJS04_geneDACA001583 [Acorus gramineus]|uniref:Secreted protein n=1 Tax=Acorus gramineus TaxID=55184 RepID=A0AAV9BK95_ACOGR|nr:hypothetical protein QJS04_geneDACA001583 [Acorus gramineus]